MTYLFVLFVGTEVSHILIPKAKIINKFIWIFSHQNSSRSRLPGNEFSGPVFGLWHEVAFRAPAPIAAALSPLCFFFLPPELGRRVIFFFFFAANGSDASHGGHGDQADQECEDGGEEEAPPLALHQALLVRQDRVLCRHRRLRRRHRGYRRHLLISYAKLLRWTKPEKKSNLYYLFSKYKCLLVMHSGGDFFFFCFSFCWTS